jgi:hypothetical protein
VGFQFLLFYGLTKVYTIENELLPKPKKYNSLFKIFNLERGLIFGLILLVIGLLLSIWAYTNWQSLNFGDINNSTTFRIVIPAITTILLGVQVILFSLFFSILGLKK